MCNSLASYTSIPMLVKTGSGFVRQYAPTVRGDAVKFDPSLDCDGYFSASKYMYYNNCYNYACAIASNSFAYPGRASGFSLSRPYTGDSVTKAAKSDGLQIPEKDGEIIPLATLQEAREFAAECSAQNPSASGHLVALLIGPPDPDMLERGDFHWVRCDDPISFREWSQKDAHNEATNRDFAGARIEDPSNSNWTIKREVVLESVPLLYDFRYIFQTFMFVPHDGTVQII